MKNLSLFKILFETAEEHYNISSSISGKLNKEFARDDFNRLKRLGINYAEYDPKLFSKEDNQTDAGGIQKISYPWNSKNKIILDLKNNAIFFVNSSLPEHDPLLIFQLEELASAIPEIAEFRIKKFDKKQHKEIPYNDITVEEFLNGKLSKSGTYPRYKKGEDLYDEFKFEVLKDLKDIDWYHATKVSNYKKIKTQGLRPSKDFPPEEQQKHGWTMFNFDLQNAVYLTHDIDRARDIANTLTERYSEDAIILKISGEALNDPTKIVVDEDILRDEYTDEIYPREAQGIPEYIISITSEKIAGLGYKSKILPNFIDPIEVVKVENLETED